MRYLSILLILLTFSVRAQELNCHIHINSSKIQQSDRTLFEQMQRAAYEFFANNVFTEHKMKIQERVEINIGIILHEEMGSNEYRGEIQVTYARPIFGSGYNSPVIDIRDENVIFRFSIGDVIEFNLNSSTGSLASLLTYYAYLILSIDYDTFAPLGGQGFLKIASRVVENAQSDPSPGWRSFENNGKNRAAIIEELMNDMYEPYRMCLYEYHRLGLDYMHEQPEQGRTAIIEALEKLRPIYQRRRDSYLLALFIRAKSDEIVQIFSEGSPDEKRRAYNIMNAIDPANQDKYKKIMSQGR